MSAASSSGKRSTPGTRAPRLYVETVFTFPGHFFFALGMLRLPVAGPAFASPTISRSPSTGRFFSVLLEILHFAFVLFGFLKRRKGAQVSPLACLCVLLSGIQTELTGFELTNHMEYPMRPHGAASPAALAALPSPRRSQGL